MPCPRSPSGARETDSKAARRARPARLPAGTCIQDRQERWSLRYLCPGLLSSRREMRASRYRLSPSDTPPSPFGVFRPDFLSASTFVGDRTPNGQRRLPVAPIDIPCWGRAT